jgi:hypothetical protein
VGAGAAAVDFDAEADYFDVDGTDDSNENDDDYDAVAPAVDPGANQKATRRRLKEKHGKRLGSFVFTRKQVCDVAFPTPFHRIIACRDRPAHPA